MTVLQSKATSGIGKRNYGFGSYLVVAIVAVAVGLGAAAGFAQMAGEESLTGTHEATVGRGIEVGSNLSELWDSGVAQQAAVNGAAVLQGRIGSGLIQGKAIQQSALVRSRIESGLVQQAAIHGQQPLQSRIDSGLAQSLALTQRDELNRLRVESGLAQQQAIQGTSSFEEAWAMRGLEMSKYVDELAAFGLSGLQDGFHLSWTIRGEEMNGSLEALTTSGRAQQAAVQSR